MSSNYLGKIFLSRIDLISCKLYANKKRFQSDFLKPLILLWAQLGSNQRPPDYEQGGGNYRRPLLFLKDFIGILSKT
jgi:hypothetical protein